MYVKKYIYKPKYVKYSNTLFIYIGINLIYIKLIFVSPIYIATMILAHIYVI